MKLYKYLVVKKIILIFLCLFCINETNVMGFSGENFTDINTHWAKSSIVTLVQDNIINGYSDNTFKPDEEITVLEFLKMIIVAGNYKLERSGTSMWPDFYIATAKKESLIEENEILNYDASISRYQAVRIIGRFINLDEIKTGKNNFKDLDDEYKSNVLKLVNLKIINGYGDKTFKGEKSVTRAEAATIVIKALEQKRRIDFEKECNMEKRVDLSNYSSSANVNDTYSKIRYEIKNNNLQIFDDGKYSKNWGYTIKKDLINIDKIIRIIRKLIHEDSYTAVIYSPSNYTINQLKISHGENANKIINDEEDFSFTYYEDKFYELARIAMNDEFTNDCYLKIEVKKLWKDYSKYLKGEFVDEYKKEKLLDALKIEFGSSNANKILNYIIEKNEVFVSNKERDIEHTEKKIFGNYIVNYYQKEYGVPQFYISKVN